MHKREAMNRTLRWAILAACLVLAFALWRLFWMDASDGRTSREVERIESAQDRIVEDTPATTVPATADPAPAGR